MKHSMSGGENMLLWEMLIKMGLVPEKTMKEVIQNRLYDKGLITNTHLQVAVDNGFITETEKTEIAGT